MYLQGAAISVVVLRASGEETTVDANAFQVQLPKPRSARLSSLAGTEVIMGIRPEDIYDKGFEPTGISGRPLQARVDVTEMMGNEKFLHLVIGDIRLLARVDPRTKARPGQDVDLLLDADRVHLFSADTSRALDLIDIPGSAPGAAADAATNVPSGPAEADTTPG